MSRLSLRHGALAASGACLLALAVAVPANATPVTFASSVAMAPCGYEPALAIDGDDVYVTSTKGTLGLGCDDVPPPTSGAFGANLWSSHDGGATFGPAVGFGSITGGSGDSDVAVDPHTGDVYAMDEGVLDSSVCVSHDHGATFITAFTQLESCNSVANVTGQTAFADVDRVWLNTYGPTSSFHHHDVYLHYVGLVGAQPTVVRQRDGGPFVPIAIPSLGNTEFATTSLLNSGVAGKPVLADDGTIYLPYITPDPPGSVSSTIWLLKSTTHGDSYTISKVYDGGSTGAYLGLIFPSIALDGQGNVFISAAGNASGTSPASNVYVFYSTNAGTSWSSPIQVNTDTNAHAMPGLAAGPHHGNVVLGYYTATNTTDPNDVNGQWRFDVARTTDITAATPTWTYTQADGGAIVHNGDICMLGISCEQSGGNRNLGDFTSAVVDSQGCALLAYADDSQDPTWYNRVLRQTGGCF